MHEFRFGPVEMYLVGFDREPPDLGVLGALADVLDTGVVRLLDLVVVRKDGHGEVSVVEAGDRTGLALEPHPPTNGLIAEEDVVDLAGPMPRESTAVVLAVELAYRRTLAERLAGHGEVLRTERISAPVVNALMDLYEPVEGQEP
jgi:hypothetical protein